jgi:hypothetical protein
LRPKPGGNLPLRGIKKAGAGEREGDIDMRLTYKLSAAVVGAAVVTLVGTPAAKADPSTFIDDVRGAGLDADGGNPELLKVGRGICRMLSEGQTRSDIAAGLTYGSDKNQGNGGITPKQADSLILYANDDLCPGE